MRFVHKLLTVLSFTCIVAVAAGFAKYIGVGFVSFAPFPNYLDCLLLVLGASYLTWRSVKK